MKLYKVIFYSVSGKGEETSYKQVGSPIEMLVPYNHKQHLFSMAYHRGTTEQKDCMKLSIYEI